MNRYEAKLAGQAIKVVFWLIVGMVALAIVLAIWPLLVALLVLGLLIGAGVAIYRNTGTRRTTKKEGRVSDPGNESVLPIDPDDLFGGFFSKDRTNKRNRRNP